MSPNPQPKREKQMEGKIRERERRAFTARMIDGLRQHGNYNLPAGASMNQVLVAVVSEAGYTVDSDGTTYRPPPPSNVPSNEHERNSNPNPQPAGTIMGDNAAASTSGNKSRKEREKQMEHMFRERDRRAFTTRIIDGLRQHGNYNLPTGASMNQVLVAVVNEAGYIVGPDGTTYRPPPPSNVVANPARVVGNSLKNFSTTASVLRIVESLSPASFDSLVVSDTSTNSSPMNSSGCLEADQLMQEVHTGEQGNDFLGTPYVHVYVMLSSGIINNSCQLVDPDGVKEELELLKSLNIDGVVVNCWWGIVERWKNQKYEWSGYRELFNIIRNMELKLQVVMAFNAYAGNDFNVDIPLSEWVLKIGKDNPEIFFTDRVYYEFMRSFRAEFNDLFTAGLISEVPFFF
nr:beta-amylase 8 [Ipomoea batatas]